MKGIYPILAILFSFSSFAQTVQSSCTADSVIMKMYQNDADRLVLRHYNLKGYSEKDSIPINSMYSDTLMNALISVYNASDLVARDTVVKILNLHTRWDYNLNYFRLEADSGLAWMNELEQFNSSTGYAPLDDIIATYEVEILGYFPTNSNLHQVSFATKPNVNIQAICNILSVLPGVSFVQPGTDIYALEIQYSNFYQSNNITAYVNSDHVELNYTKYWGAVTRTWTFKAYYDCSVEYVGSFGSSVFASDPEYGLELTRIYPNPVRDKMTVNGQFLYVQYAILDASGKTVQSGSVANYKDIYVNELANGTYFLHLHSDTERKTIQFIKNN